MPLSTCWHTTHCGSDNPHTVVSAETSAIIKMARRRRDASHVFIFQRAPVARLVAFIDFSNFTISFSSTVTAATLANQYPDLLHHARTHVQFQPGRLFCTATCGCRPCGRRHRIFLVSATIGNCIDLSLTVEWSTKAECACSQGSDHPVSHAEVHKKSTKFVMSARSSGPRQLEFAYMGSQFDVTAGV